MSRASLPRNLTPARAQQMAAGFLERRRALHGDATMTTPVTTETTTTETTPEVEQTTTETKTVEPEAKFTQADLDRIIGERVAVEKAKHDQALKDAQALAGKNETEKLTIERDQAAERAKQATTQAAQRIARTEAKGIARDLDVRSDRLDAVLKQADLTGAIGEDGEVDEAKLKAAVEKVVADYPEWKKTTTTTQSGGELNGGGGGGKPTFTRKQLEEMPQAEMTARIDEINEAIADGRVTG